jgi:iron complex transport system permease protein
MAVTTPGLRGSEILGDADGNAVGPDDVDLERVVAGSFRMPWWAFLGGVVLLFAALLASALQGAAGLPMTGVLRSLLDHVPGVPVEGSLTPVQDAVLWQIRLPRAVLGALVGAGLAMAGAAYQGVFRNPLADPYLLGVSAGAGLGAVLALGFGLDLAWGPVSTVASAAFLGALLAVCGSALVARGRFDDPATLLLSGVAMAALFSAGQTFLLQRLDYTRAREVLSWLFGKLATDGWDPVWLLAPYVAVGGLVLILHARHLDVLRVGDDEARALGLHPPRARLIVIVTATLVIAAAVSVSGSIAFVGLVVPHIVRLLVSHSYRVIVPLSALVGGAFLSVVDIGARTLTAPAELPVGVITAFVGAPFFAFVLWRGRRRSR